MKAYRHNTRIPVTIPTIIDDEREIAQCHRPSCNIYTIKPVTSEEFSAAVRRLGLYFPIVTTPGEE